MPGTVDPQKVMEELLTAVGASHVMTDCEILEVRLDEDCEVADEELWFDVRYRSAYDGSEQTSSFDAHPNLWGTGGDLMLVMLIQVAEDEADRVGALLGAEPGCPPLADPQPPGRGTLTPTAED